MSNDNEIKQFVKEFLDNPIHRIVFNRLSQIDSGEPKNIFEGVFDNKK